MWKTRDRAAIDSPSRRRRPVRANRQRLRASLRAAFSGAGRRHPEPIAALTRVLLVACGAIRYISRLGGRDGDVPVHCSMLPSWISVGRKRVVRKLLAAVG